METGDLQFSFLQGIFGRGGASIDNKLSMCIICMVQLNIKRDNTHHAEAFSLVNSY